MKTSKTWWGQKFITALTEFTEEGRLTRGRAYRTDNRVKQWDISGSKITAKIRGNKNPYFGVYKEPTYTTTLALIPISTKQWNKLLLAIGENAGAICKLMNNEMPDDIEQPFDTVGLHLLPLSNKDFTVNCSCPDYAVPCKHIAGVFYRLAEQLDHDPLLLFQLRGLSHQQLHQQLAKSALGEALLLSLSASDTMPEPLESYYTRPKELTIKPPMDVKSFWLGETPLLPLKLPQRAIEPSAGATISALLIKKGGEFPPFWDRDNSFIEAMEGYYAALRKNGQKLL
ncbi:MAG: putative Zn finger protein [Alteromonadaceae bacterium]|jgi:uncharacterized Zn finger protein